MLRILVCVSGGGTNLQAILDAIDNGTITNTRVAELYVIMPVPMLLSGQRTRVFPHSAFLRRIILTELLLMRHFWRK